MCGSVLAGMIPRAVEHIFTGIEERRTAAAERNEPAPQFQITAQFLEVGRHIQVLRISGGLFQSIHVVLQCIHVV